MTMQLQSYIAGRWIGRDAAQTLRSASDQRSSTLVPCHPVVLPLSSFDMPTRLNNTQ